MLKATCGRIPRVLWREGTWFGVPDICEWVYIWDVPWDWETSVSGLLDIGSGPFADLFDFWEGSASREKSEAIGDGKPGPVGRWGFSAESTNPDPFVDKRFVDFIAPFSVVHQGTECNIPMCQHFLCVPTRPGHSRIFFYGRGPQWSNRYGQGGSKERGNWDDPESMEQESVNGVTSTTSKPAPGHPEVHKDFAKLDFSGISRNIAEGEELFREWIEKHGSFARAEGGPTDP